MYVLHSMFTCSCHGYLMTPPLLTLFPGDSITLVVASALGEGGREGWRKGEREKGGIGRKGNGDMYFWIRKEEKWKRGRRCDIEEDNNIIITPGFSPFHGLLWGQRIQPGSLEKGRRGGREGMREGLLWGQRVQLENSGREEDSCTDRGRKGGSKSPTQTSPCFPISLRGYPSEMLLRKRWSLQCSS